MSGTLLLLLVNAPLVPVQGFAVGLSILGALNLIALLGARRPLEDLHLAVRANAGE